MLFSTSQKIILASGNPGKIREIQSILKDHPIIPQSHFNIEEAKETGTTFVENAVIKARNASLHSQLPAIADDSGLVVDALNGAPGVISARFAGEGATDQKNLLKLLDDMQDIPSEQRTARFVCVLVFLRSADDPLPIIAQGVWEGQILIKPVGNNGFGYDPVFWVPTHNMASAELAPDIKNAISHRSQALTLLTDSIKQL